MNGRNWKYYVDIKQGRHENPIIRSLVIICGIDYCCKREGTGVFLLYLLHYNDTTLWTLVM